MEDWRLLQQYTENGSEAAFKVLVDRHMDLVYSTALRRLRDPQAAQEVSQSVFCLLAQKARRLRSDTAFVSWLYRTTCYKAARYCRAEWRRRKREEEVARMQNTEPATENSPWQHILPHLDEALRQLSEPDRLAILLRFFQRKPLKDVGAVLGIGEDAARMRISRALGKLHGSLARKGVSISAVALATEMANSSVQETPLGRATLVRKAALEAAKAISAPTLLTTLIILMANAKLKFGLGLIVALIAGGVGMLLMTKSPKDSRVEDNLTGPTLGTQLEQAANERVMATLPTRRSKALERQVEIQNLISKLQKALREEAVVTEGNIFSYPVAPAVRAFKPNMTEALPTLLAGIRDKEDLVRINAALGIGYMEETAREAIPQLLELAKDPNERTEVRQTALNGLDYIAGRDPASMAGAIPDLIELLNDSNCTSMAVIGAMGSYARDAVPAIIALLDSSSTRLSAIKALQQIGPEANAAIPVLEQLLQESDKRLRASAGIALWKIAGRTDVVAAIAEDLSPGSDWRFEYLKILGEMGPAAQPAIKVVEHLTRFSNPDIREPALAALSKINPKEAAVPQHNQ
jgi:RNA polymerase sigma factor (sigma-70 family)